jgi:hypothetical protein
MPEWRPTNWKNPYDIHWPRSKDGQSDTGSRGRRIAFEMGADAVLEALISHIADLWNDNDKLVFILELIKEHNENNA